MPASVGPAESERRVLKETGIREGSMTSTSGAVTATAPSDAEQAIAVVALAFSIDPAAAGRPRCPPVPHPFSGDRAGGRGKAFAHSTGFHLRDFGFRQASGRTKRPWRRSCGEASTNNQRRLSTRRGSPRRSGRRTSRSRGRAPAHPQRPGASCEPRMDDLHEPAVGTDRDLDRLAELVRAGKRIIDGRRDVRVPARRRHHAAAFVPA